MFVCWVKRKEKKHQVVWNQVDEQGMQEEKKKFYFFSLSFLLLLDDEKKTRVNEKKKGKKERKKKKTQSPSSNVRSVAFDAGSSFVVVVVVVVRFDWCFMRAREENNRPLLPRALFSLSLSVFVPLDWMTALEAAAAAAALMQMSQTLAHRWKSSEIIARLHFKGSLSVAFCRQLESLLGFTTDNKFAAKVYKQTMNMSWWQAKNGFDWCKQEFFSRFFLLLVDDDEFDKNLDRKNSQSIQLLFYLHWIRRIPINVW